MDEIKFRVENNTIIMDSGVTCSFKYDIEKWLVHRLMIFILLKVPLKVIYNENVFALNNQGNIVWQIREIECPWDLSSCNFTGLNVQKDTGNLLLYNWSGILYTVIPETGEIIDEVLAK